MRLWAVDLNPHLARTAATFVFFDFLMGGARSLETGEYLVDPDPDRAVRERERKTSEFSTMGGTSSEVVVAGGGDGSMDGVGVDAAARRRRRRRRRRRGEDGSGGGSDDGGGGSGGSSAGIDDDSDGGDGDGDGDGDDDVLSLRSESEGGVGGEAGGLGGSESAQRLQGLMAGIDVGSSKAGRSNIPEHWKGRCYAAVDELFHPNLSSLQYNAFFSLCRLKGISFDLKERLGAAFLLSDSLAGGLIGLMGVGGTPAQALKTLQNTLTFIESQVGSFSQQDEFEDEKSNFTDVTYAVKSALKRYSGGGGSGGGEGKTGRTGK
jgi:hypothetical protein